MTKNKRIANAKAIVETVKKMRNEHGKPRATIQSVYFTTNEWGTKENWNHHYSIKELYDFLKVRHVKSWKIEWLPKGEKDIHLEMDVDKSNCQRFEEMMDVIENRPKMCHLYERMLIAKTKRGMPWNRFAKLAEKTFSEFCVKIGLDEDWEWQWDETAMNWYETWFDEVWGCVEDYSRNYYENTPWSEIQKKIVSGIAWEI